MIISHANVKAEIPLTGIQSQQYDFQQATLHDTKSPRRSFCK